MDKEQVLKHTLELLDYITRLYRKGELSRI